uniref:Uncharacterized protein n=1 Tax=Pseudomonas phage Touem01 TaxID=3138548 RepID=A0AAU6W1W2_9VIRU
MTASSITRIRFNTSPIRKQPKAGDERFLKGRKVHQIRQQVRYWTGPYRGSYAVSNGRPVWEWVDKGSDRDRTSDAWRAAMKAQS